jgi:nucleotide-binding universal stress UspA family protein
MSGYTAKSVVVPVDFSDDSFAAVDIALQVAESPSGVRVVHVIPELNIAEPGVIWQEIDNENRAQHAIQALRERLTADKYREIQVDVEIGDPGYRIAEFAQRNGAELIVVSSHGRTGLAHMLLGSVAERVLRLSHCPVLVIRS